MNQQLDENETSKILDNLNYPSQADIMTQRLFFIQTETIRQQRINDERVVEALMNIAANNPNGSVRKEASKTLKYLGITLPPINPKLAKEDKARDIAIGFFGWLVIWNSLGIVVFVYYEYAVIIELIGLVLFFALGKKWIGFGAVSYVITNTILVSGLFGESIFDGLTIPFTTLFFAY